MNCLAEQRCDLRHSFILHSNSVLTALCNSGCFTLEMNWSRRLKESIKETVQVDTKLVYLNGNRKRWSCKLNYQIEMKLQFYGGLKILKQFYIHSPVINPIQCSVTYLWTNMYKDCAAPNKPEYNTYQNAKYLPIHKELLHNISGVLWFA